jgi:hypothetical protein
MGQEERAFDLEVGRDETLNGTSCKAPSSSHAAGPSFLLLADGWPLPYRVSDDAAMVEGQLDFILV